MQNLDFDFEKCCSVSLSPINVYACLVCGKYFQVTLHTSQVTYWIPCMPMTMKQAIAFQKHHAHCARCTWRRSASNTLSAAIGQGRGRQTHAYTHSLETGHHMFMKLEDGRVYCLPDGYEVVDRSLDVIRFVLNPTFTDAEVLLKPPSATSIRPTLWTAPLWQGRPVHPRSSAAFCIQLWPSGNHGCCKQTTP